MFSTKLIFGKNPSIIFQAKLCKKIIYLNFIWRNSRYKPVNRIARTDGSFGVFYTIKKAMKM